MKIAAGITLLASAVSAHYTFPGLIYGGVTEADWTYVRETTNHYSHGPVQDVTDPQIRCYQLADGNEGAATMAVTAGSTVGFRVDPGIQHPGPLSFYMAKAPGAAADFAGDGDVWFKIYEEHPTVDSTGLHFASYEQALTTVSVTIPSCITSGDYLLRVEHIGLHAAGSTGGAQFYQACSQLTVTGGTGKVTPAGVALPGAYSATDPGILINLYWPIPTNYTNPGPDPITC